MPDDAAATYVVATYMYLFFYLLLNNLWVLIAGVLASRKGRSVGGWIFGGMTLGLIAVIILAFLSDQTVRARPRIVHTTKSSSTQDSSPQGFVPSHWKNL